MKAKEYFNRFINENQDRSIELRLLMVFNDMLMEIKTIQNQRNTKSDRAFIAIMKELEVKSRAFVRLVNEIEPFKSEGELKHNAFMLFVEQQYPELAKIYNKFKGKRND